MTTLEKIRQMRGQVYEVANKYGATNLRVFGSVLHNTDTENSDIDILADWDNYDNPMGRIYIVNELQDLLGKKVDFVIAKNLHWVIKDEVISEAQPL